MHQICHGPRPHTLPHPGAPTPAAAGDSDDTSLSIFDSSAALRPENTTTIYPPEDDEMGINILNPTIHIYRLRTRSQDDTAALLKGSKTKKPKAKFNQSGANADFVRAVSALTLPASRQPEASRVHEDARPLL